MMNLHLDVNDSGFISELTDPWAPHPVVNRHVCNGGGGSSAPTPPDYTNFNTGTMQNANELTGFGRDLFAWAKSKGVKLSDLADTVSKRAGDLADWTTQQAKDAYSNWNQTYGPVYQQIAKRALDFGANLPQTMESWAGKYGADAVMAIDQGKASLLRKLTGEGLTRPSVAQGAIDLAQNNQRSLAGVAAAEQGRMQAMQYGDTLNTQAAQTAPGALSAIQGVSPFLSAGLAGGNQQVGAPESAFSTTVGGFAPSIGMYNAALPYQNASLQAMQSTYQNELGQFNANQQASSNSPLTTLLPLGLGLAGSIMAPGLAGGFASMIPGGTSLASAAGAGAASRAGRGFLSATGGTVPAMAAGGVPMAGQMVPPQMSPSGGARTDDVPAMVDGNPRNIAAINTGEFILPKRTLAWIGEKGAQAIVAKADKERQEQTVAAPTAGPPPGAIKPQAPPMMGAMA